MYIIFVWSFSHVLSIILWTFWIWIDGYLIVLVHTMWMKFWLFKGLEIQAKDSNSNVNLPTLILLHQDLIKLKLSKGLNFSHSVSIEKKCDMWCNDMLCISFRARLWFCVYLCTYVYTKMRVWISDEFVIKTCSLGSKHGRENWNLNQDRKRNI